MVLLIFFRRNYVKKMLGPSWQVLRYCRKCQKIEILTKGYRLNFQLVQILIQHPCNFPFITKKLDRVEAVWTLHPMFVRRFRNHLIGVLTWLRFHATLLDNAMDFRGIRDQNFSRFKIKDQKFGCKTGISDEKNILCYGPNRDRE